MTKTESICGSYGSRIGKERGRADDRKFKILGQNKIPDKYGIAQTYQVIFGYYIIIYTMKGHIII